MATLQASASSPKIIGFTCTDVELFNSFDKMTGGSPLPSNVIDLNPFSFEPQYLPDGVWFLISSNANIDIDHGMWQIKEEACEVFSNSEIIGWRTTFEYYRGRVPHQHKTDWVMQVFSITLKRLCNDNDKKEASSLCRVFLVSSHEMQQKASNAGTENEAPDNLTLPPVLDANSSTRIGSSSNREVNTGHETEVLAQRLPVPVPVPEHQGDNILEMDWSSFSRGEIGFLELQDLDTPASSSSSENSSAVSISSGEYFDSMALLRDLDDPILEHNDAGRRLNVSASNKSDEVVILPATLGSLVSIEGSNPGSDEFFRATGSVPASASGSRNLNNKVTEHAEGNQRGEGPSSSSSSSSHKPSAASDSHAAAGGGKRAPFGGMKKLRNFMPF